MKKKVFIILETGSQAGRSQLIGILRAINAMHLAWDMDIALPRRKTSASMVRRALDKNTDGFILAQRPPQDHPVHLAADQRAAKGRVVRDPSGFRVADHRVSGAQHNHP